MSPTDTFQDATNRCSIKMASDVYSKDCQFLFNTCGDSVTIQAKRAEFGFMSRTTTRSEILIRHGTSEGVEVDLMGEPFDLGFSLKFLSMTSHASSFAKTVTLYLVPDNPLMIHFSFDMVERQPNTEMDLGIGDEDDDEDDMEGDGSDLKECFVSIYVAPKMDEDDMC